MSATAMQIAFDRWMDGVWEEFRESQRDPEAYAEKVRVRKLADEQDWIRRRVAELRSKLKWEEGALSKHKMMHGNLESNHQRFLREIKQ